MNALDQTAAQVDAVVRGRAGQPQLVQHAPLWGGHYFTKRDDPAPNSFAAGLPYRDQITVVNVALLDAPPFLGSGSQRLFNVVAGWVDTQSPVSRRACVRWGLGAPSLFLKSETGSLECLCQLLLGETPWSFARPQLLAVLRTKRRGQDRSRRVSLAIDDDDPALRCPVPVPRKEANFTELVMLADRSVDRGLRQFQQCASISG